MNSLQLQLHAVIILGLAGAMAAFLFDALRTVRWVLGTRHLSAMVADLLYWVIVAALLIVAMIAGNWGDLRLYVPFAVAAGAGVYFYLAGSAVRTLMRATVAFCAWAIDKLVTAVSLLVVQPLVWTVFRLWGGTVFFSRLLFRPLDSLLLQPFGRVLQPLTARLTGLWTGLTAWFHPPDSSGGEEEVGGGQQEPSDAPREN